MLLTNWDGLNLHGEELHWNQGMAGVGWRNWAKTSPISPWAMLRITRRIRLRWMMWQEVSRNYLKLKGKPQIISLVGNQRIALLNLPEFGGSQTERGENVITSIALLCSTARNSGKDDIRKIMYKWRNYLISGLNQVIECQPVTQRLD